MHTHTQTSTTWGSKWLYINSNNENFSVLVLDDAWSCRISASDKDLQTPWAFLGGPFIGAHANQVSTTGLFLGTLPPHRYFCLPLGTVFSQLTAPLTLWNSQNWEVVCGTGGWENQHCQDPPTECNMKWREYEWNVAGFPLSSSSSAPSPWDWAEHRPEGTAPHSTHNHNPHMHQWPQPYKWVKFITHRYFSP